MLILSTFTLYTFDILPKIHSSYFVAFQSTNDAFDFNKFIFFCISKLLILLQPFIFIYTIIFVIIKTPYINGSMSLSQFDFLDFDNCIDMHDKEKAAKFTLIYVIC